MKTNLFRASVILLTITLWHSTASAQDVPSSVSRVVAGIPVNYDEALVGTYTLPDPLVMLNGKKGLGTNVWPAAGQPILNDLEYYMHAGDHGAIPGDYPIFIKFMMMHFFDQK